MSPLSKTKSKKVLMVSAFISLPFKKAYLDIQNVGSDNYTALGLHEKYTNIQLELRRAMDSLDLIARWHDYMIVSLYFFIILNAFISVRL